MSNTSVTTQGDTPAVSEYQQRLYRYADQTFGVSGNDYDLIDKFFGVEIWWVTTDKAHSRIQAANAVTVARYMDSINVKPDTKFINQPAIKKEMVQWCTNIFGDTIDALAVFAAIKNTPNMRNKFDWVLKTDGSHKFLKDIQDQFLNGRSNSVMDRSGVVPASVPAVGWKDYIDVINTLNLAKYSTDFSAGSKGVSYIYRLIDIYGRDCLPDLAFLLGRGFTFRNVHVVLTLISEGVDMETALAAYSGSKLSSS